MVGHLSNNIAYKIIENCKNLDKKAIFFERGDLSYDDLLKLSGNFAGFLMDHNIIKGDRLLICLDDSPALSIIFLSCLASGVIPIAVNPRLSRQSLAYILADSEAKVLCIEPDLLNNIHYAPQSRYLIVVNDLYKSLDTSIPDSVQLSEALASKNALNPIPICEDESVFWQYTSGTTGNPKGVQHGPLTMLKNTELYARSMMSFSDDDLFYSSAKMFFGYGLGASFFFPLLLNASVLLDSRTPASDMIVASNLIKHQPTAFFGVPAIYNALLAAAKKLAPDFPKNIKYISAGAPLPKNTFEQWRLQFDNIIFDGIGTTELGHIYLSNSPSLVLPGKTGVPVPGYEVKLIDKHGESEGILAVKPPHGNIGYWKSPEKNAEKFVDGWYITGDAFEVDDAGSYRYLGRSDDLFKINGIWVVPQLIESKILSNFETIKELALIGQPDQAGMLETALYIVLHDETQESLVKPELSSWLKHNVEAHSRPRMNRIHFLSALPRNENGKVMRNRLAGLNLPTPIETA